MKKKSVWYKKESAAIFNKHVIVYISSDGIAI